MDLENHTGKRRMKIIILRAVCNKYSSGMALIVNVKVL